MPVAFRSVIALVPPRLKCLISVPDPNDADLLSQFQAGACAGWISRCSRDVEKSPGILGRHQKQGLSRPGRFTATLLPVL